MSGHADSYIARYRHDFTSTKAFVSSSRKERNNSRVKNPPRPTSTVARPGISHLEAHSALAETEIHNRRSPRWRDAFHRAFINSRGESKAPLIGGVMTSFLITRHRRGNAEPERRHQPVSLLRTSSLVCRPTLSLSFSVSLIRSRGGSIIVININATI